MRTTLTLDDELARTLGRLAQDSGRSLNEVVNQVLQAGLAAGERSVQPRPYRLQPVQLGDVQPGIDLTQALQFADELEDRELRRKMERGR